MNELYHYGILGMRWGVRRFQNKDGSYTAAGKKRYDKSEEGRRDDNRSSFRSRKIAKYEAEYKKKNKDNLSDEEIRAKAEQKYKRRRNVMIAGAVVVAAYAGYKFVDSGSAHALMQKGQRLLHPSDDLFNKNDNLAGDLSTDEIMSSVVSRINPNYGAPGTKNNCRRCTFAYELSRRGYDVRATRTHGATGQNGAGLYEAVNTGRQTFFHGPISTMGLSLSEAMRQFRNNPDDYDVESVASQFTGNLCDKNNIFSTLASSNPNRARGEVMLRWTIGGAHSMAYEIIDGTAHIFDNQTGKHYDPETFSKYLPYIAESRWTRLDNVQLDMDFLDRWITNA